MEVVGRTEKVGSTPTLPSVPLFHITRREGLASAYKLAIYHWKGIEK